LNEFLEKLLDWLPTRSERLTAYHDCHPCI
jgi:hypothetical protein